VLARAWRLRLSLGVWGLPLLRAGFRSGYMTSTSAKPKRICVKPSARADAMEPCVLWITKSKRAGAGLPRDQGVISAFAWARTEPGMAERKTRVFSGGHVENDVQSGCLRNLIRKARLMTMFFVDLPSACRQGNDSLSAIFILKAGGELRRGLAALTFTQVGRNPVTRFSSGNRAGRCFWRFTRQSAASRSRDDGAGSPDADITLVSVVMAERLARLCADWGQGALPVMAGD